MVAKRKDLEGLPDWPRLMSKPQAACYCGMSEKAFDTIIKVKPIIDNGARIIRWDKKDLDEALDRLRGSVPESGRDVINLAISEL